MSAANDESRSTAKLGAEIPKCRHCNSEAPVRHGCKKQRMEVCHSHAMIDCPVCGHEAFWLSGMKSGSYYACFSLNCNWRSTEPPNVEVRGEE